MTIYSSYRHLPPAPSLAGPLPAQAAQGEGVAPGAGEGAGHPANWAPTWLY